MWRWFPNTENIFIKNTWCFSKKYTTKSHFQMSPLFPQQVCLFHTEFCLRRHSEVLAQKKKKTTETKFYLNWKLNRCISSSAFELNLKVTPIFLEWLKAVGTLDRGRLSLKLSHCVHQELGGRGSTLKAEGWFF